jgi:hypothetical protein
MALAYPKINPNILFIYDEPFVVYAHGFPLRIAITLLKVEIEKLNCTI